MKKCILLCLVLLCISEVSSQSEKLLVNYKTKTAYSVEKSLTEEEKKVSWKVEYARKMKRDIESLEYSLKIDNNKSEFELIEKLKFSDYETNSMASVDQGHRYYVDHEQFIERLNFSGEEFLIVEKAKGFKWKLKNESKEILGFTCYKATYEKTGEFGIKIDAWYAPELPFPFGPKGYNGLPGLILEIVQNDLLTNTASSIDFSEDIVVIKPTKGKVITRAEFDSKVQSTVTTMKSFNKN